MKAHKYLSIGLVLLAATLLSAQQHAARSRGTFEVTGKVVNSVTGELVRGASIQLAPVTDRSDIQRFESASDGSFVFHNLAAGKYSLSAQAPRFPFQAFEQHGGYSTAIVVGGGKNSTDILFRLRPEGSISGQVLDEHNEPVRNAQVMLFEKSTDTGKRLIERRTQMQTDDLGQYHFLHLRQGTYYVAITAQPWYRRYMQPISRMVSAGQIKPDVDPALDVAYPVTYYPNATDPDQAGAIVLHPGDRISADFNLMPVQALHLTLNTGAPDARLQPNFRERVFGEPFGFVQPTMVWNQGEVEVSGIAPGDYDLEIMHRDGAENSVQNQELNLQSDGEIDPNAGDEIQTIHGTIKFEGSDPPSNAFIQFRDADSGRMAGARVEENGDFRIQPRHTGRYVIALGNAAGYAIQSISATGAKVSGRTIDVAGSEAVELTIKASQGVGTVNGTVMNGDQPLSAAMVVLVPPDINDNLSLFRRDQSDSDGTFTLPDVVPGTYTAIAIQNGWDMEWGSPDALRPYMAKGTRIQITGKQTVDIKVVAQ